MNNPDIDENLNEKTAVINALRAVGSVWARYGLTVGRAALESSARSLQVTATALGQLAEAIDDRARAAQEANENDRKIVVESRD